MDMHHINHGPHPQEHGARPPFHTRACTVTACTPDARLPICPLCRAHPHSLHYTHTVPPPVLSRIHAHLLTHHARPLAHPHLFIHIRLPSLSPSRTHSFKHYAHPHARTHNVRTPVCPSLVHPPRTHLRLCTGCATYAPTTRAQGTNLCTKHVYSHAPQPLYTRTRVCSASTHCMHTQKLRKHKRYAT